MPGCVLPPNGGGPGGRIALRRGARCAARSSGRGTRPGSGGGRRPCRRGACEGGIAGGPDPDPDGTGHDVERGSQHLAVVAVRPAQLEAQRRALGIDDEVALGAGPPAVRGVRPDLGRRRRAPPFAGMDALSMDALLQSSSSAAASRSSKARCRSPSTPAACQSRSLRQHVMPVQPNTPRGSRSQPMPDHRTNTMPSRARRSSHRGRPPFGLGGSSGSSGATAAHSSSLTRGLLMMPQRGLPTWVLLGVLSPEALPGIERGGASVFLRHAGHAGAAERMRRSGAGRARTATPRCARPPSHRPRGRPRLTTPRRPRIGAWAGRSREGECR